MTTAHADESVVGTAPADSSVVGNAPADSSVAGNAPACDSVAGTAPADSSAAADWNQRPSGVTFYADNRCTQCGYTRSHSVDVYHSVIYVQCTVCGLLTEHPLYRQ